MQSHANSGYLSKITVFVQKTYFWLTVLIKIGPLRSFLQAEVSICHYIKVYAKRQYAKRQYAKRQMPKGSMPKGRCQKVDAKREYAKKQNAKIQGSLFLHLLRPCSLRFGKVFKHHFDFAGEKLKDHLIFNAQS